MSSVGEVETETADISYVYSLDFYNNTVEYNNLRYESHKRVLELVAIELGYGDKVEELTEKFLGKPVKFKKRKDPNLPKRPLSAYFYFCKDARPKLKAKHPEIKLVDFSKLLGKIWSGLSEEEKTPYRILQEKDRERYDEEMELYQQESIL